MFKTWASVAPQKGLMSFKTFKKKKKKKSLVQVPEPDNLLASSEHTCGFMMGNRIFMFAHMFVVDVTRSASGFTTSICTKCRG